MGVHVPKEDVLSMFTSLDTDRSGAVSLDELQAALVRRLARRAEGVEEGEGVSRADAEEVVLDDQLAGRGWTASSEEGARAVAKPPAAAIDVVVDAPRRKSTGRRGAAPPLGCPSASHDDDAKPRSSAIRKTVDAAMRVVEVEGSARSPAGAGLRRQTSILRMEMRKSLRETSGQSRLWAFKVFKLAPCCAMLRHLDHPARICFPLGYTVFLLAKLSEVGAI